ncbi:MAG: GlmU family protein [Bacteroidales bacterium]|nr:GlmU family protein [Bacteroidales bacterium]
MNYILFDSACRKNLLPLTFTRPVADIRFGILTIREKWEMYLKTKTSSLTEDYLGIKFPLVKSSVNMLIDGSVCPNQALVDAISGLKEGQALVKEDSIVAMCLNANSLENINESNDEMEIIETNIDFLKLNYTWDVFHKNDQAIRDDYTLLTKGRKSQPLPADNKYLNPDNIFIEEGAVLHFATLNASTGPIYIGKNSEVMEGVNIRGPFALGEEAVVKMGAKIYGPTTIGPHSKVGGEINQSVVFGYSNKAHDGFLGHSVIGEWCNIGADSNTSNLMNTYEEVKLWSYAEDCFVQTGLQFCGTIMGDFSKCGINTMFNTGTVIGVSANIFGAGYQRNFIPSFSWGGTMGVQDYNLKKAFKTNEAVFLRRNKTFDKTEKDILTEIFGLTYKNRRA